MLGPREIRATWDDSFMLMAISMSLRSPDSHTQVGSVIVDSENRLIGAGYNGPPKGISPMTIPWDREGEKGKTKYDFVLHAEYNALNNTTADTKNAKCYVTLQPCNVCAMSLIQAGIKEVIYLDDKYKDAWFTKLGIELLERVGINVRQHKWSENISELVRAFQI
jgi:dCMP deaminase